MNLFWLVVVRTEGSLTNGSTSRHLAELIHAIKHRAIGVLTNTNCKTETRRGCEHVPCGEQVLCAICLTFLHLIAKVLSIVGADMAQKVDIVFTVEARHLLSRGQVGALSIESHTTHQHRGVSVSVSVGSSDVTIRCETAGTLFWANVHRHQGAYTSHK